MLNPKTQERMLAYIEKVTNITPIEKADRLEAVHINGWVCVCGKGEFQVGDIGIFFEIDSKLPEVFPFTEMNFLKDKKYKIKSQKICGQISQGLFVPIKAFVNGKDIPSWVEDLQFHIRQGDDIIHRDLTSIIGVTYAVKEDNVRKNNNNINTKENKYKKMCLRHPIVFRQSWAHWMMRHILGAKIMFFFFGQKIDTKKNGWPSWVKKTDEERIQNIPDIVTNKEPWIVTEKIDGTSTTFTIHKKKYNHNKYDFYVCSRNVVFDKPNKKCFYDKNIYQEMAVKYNIEKVLWQICKDFNQEWITLQGETYGTGVQKRDYGMKNCDFRGFNLIFADKGRLNSEKSASIVALYGNIPWVPILKTDFILPDTIEEVLDYAKGTSQIDGGMREGLVFRSQDGVRSFKAVSNEYLLKYHQ